MEIIAALIIACSNLVQPAQVPFNNITKEKAIEIKVACIKRVSDCGFKSITSNGQLSRQFNCSKEVY